MSDADKLRMLEPYIGIHFGNIPDELQTAFLEMNRAGLATTYLGEMQFTSEGQDVLNADEREKKRLHEEEERQAAEKAEAERKNKLEARRSWWQTLAQVFLPWLLGLLSIDGILRIVKGILEKVRKP